MRLKWLMLWLLQGAAMYGLSLLAALADAVGPWLYGVLVWVVLPLAGAWGAYRVTRGGLNNYVAWIMPPLMMVLGHMTVWVGYLPGMGPVLLSAFIAIVGAAAGDVVNREKIKGNGHE